MLTGFECDEDHTSWLAGAALWASGAVAGCLLAIASLDASSTILHWQVLVLACSVSLVSLGLRLPVLFAKCEIPEWLSHAIWMIALFAQINWSGFLAMRAPNATVAAEAIIICWGMEAWLFVACRSKLTWLGRLFGQQPSPTTSLKSAVLDRNSTALREAEQADAPDEECGDVRREFVDGIDENGKRYLSGSVQVRFEPNQRLETIVLSFCPALDAHPAVELECESEEVTAKVEHATEIGARILVRRQSSLEQLSNESLSTSIEWFAQASDEPAPTHQLP